MKEKYYVYKFNCKKEYKLYKKVGRKNKECHNYLEWKKSILNKYDKINHKDYFINFSRYLEKEKRDHKHWKERIIGIIFPAFILMISVLITMPSFLSSESQHIDSILLESTDLYIETNKGSDVENWIIRRDNLLEIVDRIKDNLGIMEKILISIVVIIFVYSFYFMITIRHHFKRTNFYNDYIEVINEIIENLSKEDKLKRKIRYLPNKVIKGNNKNIIKTLAP